MDRFCWRKNKFFTFSLLSTYGGCDFRKSEADSSDDGSSFLLPLSASSSLSTKGASTRNSSSLKRLSNRLSENAYSDTEIGNPDSRNFRSENNSDFEVTDLDLERFDSDSAEIDSKLAVGSRTNLFQGSTNNLADFESNELDLGGARARPDTLEISRYIFNRFPVHKCFFENGNLRLTRKLI